jgi:hypothetical protein
MFHSSTFTYDVTAGMQIVQMLQPIIMPGRRMLGRTFANHRFPGS